MRLRTGAPAEYDGREMIAEVRRHEADVLGALASGPSREALQELFVHHNRQIAWLQHERLAHLITMLFVCLFAVLALVFALVRFSLPALGLAALLLGLAAAYVWHYYRLENAVQRWYGISNRIRSSLLTKP